jgi:hypothetical protein
MVYLDGCWLRLCPAGFACASLISVVAANDWTGTALARSLGECRPPHG